MKEGDAIVNRWGLVSLVLLLAIVNAGCSGLASQTNDSAPAAPSITTQPASQTVTPGQTANFTVAATGTAPLSYQWRKNGTPISGATSSSYTTPATTSSDNGAQFTAVISNALGSVISNNATLTVNTAPVAPSITTQPANQTVVVGQTATFIVAATGTAPLSYQWRRNGTAIAGATSSNYTTPVTANSDNGAQFTVVVSNTVGSVTSNAATLTVNATPVAPSITTQPVSQTVTAGQTATFTAAAAGTAPLSYQWRKNSVAISGATSSSYTTPATSSSDNGAQFTVVVSNTAGSATSNAATLTVNPPPLGITTSSLPGGQVQSAYSATLNATGGTAPYIWSLLSGLLPNGLGLSSSTGTISGTATLAGLFPFVIEVRDSAGGSASSSLSINIATLPLPTVAITTPANGATVSGTIPVTGTASGGVSLTSVQVAIDSGSFSNASGTSNWTFSLNTTSLSNGPHTLTAKVTDTLGNMATSSPVTITVNNSALASDCTLFASPSGNNSNSGTSPSAPKTLDGATSATVPGSVVCLMGGTYFRNTQVIPHSGTPSAWITYQAYGDSPANLVWTGTSRTGAPNFFVMEGSGFWNGPAYVRFLNMNFDGGSAQYAAQAFFCLYAHHLTFIGNNIKNTGGSGIASKFCDYLISDHNTVHHSGYQYGWTSAISYNSHVAYDSYTGFHNIISNNILVGEFDSTTNHSDGNGIILDLGGNTPQTLIINNVVYGNGGRCITANVVNNYWIVNNTCYANQLDLTMNLAIGSIDAQSSSNGYFVNNITVAWRSNGPSYTQYGSGNSNLHYYANLYYGSSNNFTYSDPSQFINANPLFVSPPIFQPYPLDGQYATALAPSLLGNGLKLLPASPALRRGIDPSTLPNLPAAIVADLRKYIYTDINGTPRPQGSAFDLGAYQLP